MSDLREPKKIGLRWAVGHVTTYMENVDKPHPNSPWGATLQSAMKIMREWLDSGRDGAR